MFRPFFFPRLLFRPLPLWIAATALLVSMHPAAAQAEPERSLGFRGWGPRVGVTAGPDQVHFGAQLDLGSIARHVRFVPSFELGLGDHRKLSALNLDVTYRFSSTWDVWTPYLGAGPAFFIVDTDPEIGEGSTDSDVGLSIIGGIERGFSRGTFFLDGKLGLADAPDFKATVGWTFVRG